MSASLVGSEMCIRDSRSRLSPRPHTPASSGYHHERSGRSGAAWPTVVAVSYTHLTLPTICSV
eukprot:3399837-Alexandrium_andersonii.AAC.1